MNNKAVYVYKKPGAEDFSGIALFVEYRDGTLFYHDTCHGHGIPGKMKEETTDGCILEASEKYIFSGEWQFKLLTIEAFKRKYFKLVMGGSIMVQALKTTEDLWEWYRTKYEIYP